MDFLPLISIQDHACLSAAIREKNANSDSPVKPPVPYNLSPFGQKRRIKQSCPTRR
jgi:hypothetical protein